MTDLHKKRAVTLVLVTHDHALASEAQRQIILKDGRVIADELNRRDAETPRVLSEVSVN
jgi:putative ABC transport system ATP-binding protein